MNPLIITYVNVYSALLMLNVSSTPGRDGVHPEVLRSCAGLLAYPLTLLFERLLRTGDIASHSLEMVSGGSIVQVSFKKFSH